jgi:hypothetical protein
MVYWIKEAVGEPLFCIVGKSVSDDVRKAITAFCWISSTYSVKKFFDPRFGKVEKNQSCSIE